MLTRSVCTTLHFIQCAWGVSVSLLHFSSRYPSLQIQQLDSNHASSRQVRVQLSTLVLFSGLYVYIFWIKVHGTTLLRRGMFNQAFHFVAITEFPFFFQVPLCISSTQAPSIYSNQTNTHPSELNDSFKPWTSLRAHFCLR
ncbi:hypothetical protein MVEN_00007300 [Mycena venus]|uniref:Uncharacterized protein n=1 Tax=Mycena venus TaxID=2733690 RepID=A0A8H6Z990_9AGAR|nr:hypothetical protein MVEN_00007300 [Mycena venus]